MEKEKTIVLLNTLIEVNNDCINGYATASKETTDKELVELFEEFTQTSKKCKQELINAVSHSGGIPSEVNKTTGTIFSIWMEVKAAFTGNDRKSLLNSCENTEDYTVETYQKVLENYPENLNIEQITLIKSQHQLIKADHSKVKGLQDQMIAF